MCRGDGELRWWEAEDLASLPWLRHGFTGRHGGFSTGCFRSLNLGLHVGDDPVSVSANRREVAGVLGLPLHQMVCAEQVHGARVAVVGPEDAGRGALSFAGAVPGVDALACRCNRENSAGAPWLALFYADCLSVFVADPRHRALGLAHAGWKGSAAGVAAELLRTMGRAFGTDPADCRVALGPHIRNCCYTVGPEVAGEFAAMEGAVLRHGDRLRLSLEAVNRTQLLREGVPADRIEDGAPCTCCRADAFFSYRRDGQTGRMAAILGPAA